MSDINKDDELKKNNKNPAVEEVVLTNSPFHETEIDKSLLINPDELEGINPSIKDDSLEEVIIEEIIEESSENQKEISEEISSFEESNFDIEEELEKNKKEIENMIAEANSSSIKLDNNDLNSMNFSHAANSGGLPPILIPTSDGLANNSVAKKNINIPKTNAEAAPQKSLVPKYNLAFSDKLNCPFSEDDMEIINSKKMIYVTIGTKDDILAKQENIEALGKRKINYKKAVPFMQRHKAVVKAFGVIIALLIVFFIGAFTFRRQIAETVLARKIAEYALPVQSFNVVKFDTKSIELSNIKSVNANGISWSMDSFKMDYENGKVSEGNIDSMEIKGFDSKYITVFDLFQGAGFNNMTKGRNANIRRLSISGTTDFGFAKVHFSTRNASLNTDKFSSIIPVTVTSDLIDFKGEMNFRGNYLEAELSIDIKEGKTAAFHGISPIITSGIFNFKKGKEKIEVFELKLNGNDGNKNNVMFSAKATPSATKGYDFSSDIRLEKEISKDERKIIVLKANTKNTTLEGSPFRFNGKLPITLNLSGIKTNEFDANNLTAVLDGSISCVKHKCEYRLDAPSTLSADALVFTQNKHRLAFDERPTSITISPDNVPFIEVKDDNNIEYSMNLSDILLKGSYVSGLTIKGIELNPGLLNLKGIFNPNEIKNEVNIITDGGYFSDNVLGIAGLRSSIFAKTDSLPSLKLSADEVHLLGKERLLPVFSGELSLNPGVSEQYDYKILLSSLDHDMRVNRNMAVNILGSYNFFEDVGTYFINIPRITFIDGGVQLASISNHYSKFLTKLNAQVAVFGKGTINNGNYDGTIKLLIEKANFSWGAVRFSNLNGVIGFKSFYPLITDGEQSLHAGMIDIGFPIYDNSLAFRINGNERIVVDKISSKIANGTLVLIEKGFIPFDLSGGVLNTEIKNIDLSDLASSLKINNLSINGKANGKAQLYISKGFIYTDSLIETADRGLLKYTFDEYELEDEELKEQLKPLRDFNYDSIIAKIKGRPSLNNSDAYTIDLKIEGISPETNTDGTSTELNIDLQSNLSNLIKIRPILAPLPDDIAKNIKSFAE